MIPNWLPRLEVDQSLLGTLTAPPGPPGFIPPFPLDPSGGVGSLPLVPKRLSLLAYNQYPPQAAHAIPTDIALAGLGPALILGPYTSPDECSRWTRPNTEPASNRSQRVLPERTLPHGGIGVANMVSIVDKPHPRGGGTTMADSFVF